MEGKEAIIQKILNDAKAEADRIVAEADAYAESIIGKAQAEAKAKVQAAEKLAEENGREYVGRRITVAGLDLKKARLNAKTALLDKVYEESVRRLSTLPDKDYKKLISGMLDAAAEDGDTVTGAEKDKKVLTKAFFDAYGKQRGISLKLGDNYGDFSGGVILSGGGVDKNLTLEVEVGLLREKTESEIATLLFKEV